MSNLYNNYKLNTEYMRYKFDEHINDLDLIKYFDLNVDNIGLADGEYKLNLLNLYNNPFDEQE